MANWQEWHSHVVKGDLGEPMCFIANKAELYHGHVSCCRGKTAPTRQTKRRQICYFWRGDKCEKSTQKKVKLWRRKRYLSPFRIATPPSQIQKHKNVEFCAPFSCCGVFTTTTIISIVHASAFCLPACRHTTITHYAENLIIHIWSGSSACMHNSTVGKST